MSNNVSVAPSRLFPLPKSVIPTSVAPICGGSPGMTSVTRSPTSYSARSAVLASRTTSPAVRGSRPSTTCSGIEPSSAGASVQFVAIPGAPVPPTSLPSAPMTNTDWFDTTPSARSTPIDTGEIVDHGRGQRARVTAGELELVTLTEDGTDDDVGVGVGEEPLEGLVEGVGEHEGADHERDPQHDGERAQRQAAACARRGS